LLHLVGFISLLSMMHGTTNIKLITHISKFKIVITFSETGLNELMKTTVTLRIRECFRGNNDLQFDQYVPM